MNADASRGLRPIANRCTSGCCPTIYLTSSGHLVIQGFLVAAEPLGIDLGPGEALVEVPASLLVEAVAQLG